MKIIRRISLTALLLLAAPSCSDGVPFPTEKPKTDTVQDGGLRFELEAADMDEEEESVHFQATSKRL